MGALIDEKHMRRVLGYIDGGVAAGARLALGGHRALEHTGGFYVEATVLDAVHPQMRVAQEEIFGPVLSVMTFRDEAEAVRLANDTPTDSPPRCGPPTSTARTAWRRRCAAARCG